MSTHIPVVLAEFVRDRAGDCCEYCRLPQASQEGKFHIDHIQPRSHGGPTVAENLCEACVTCSLKKAARTFARDPVSRKMAPLFHPRRDRWHDHFVWTSTWRLMGKTGAGRATIQALGMNRPAVLFVRRGLAKLGLLPPN